MIENNSKFSQKLNTNGNGNITIEICIVKKK